MSLLDVIVRLLYYETESASNPGAFCLLKAKYAYKIEVNNCISETVCFQIRPFFFFFIHPDLSDQKKVGKMTTFIWLKAAAGNRCDCQRAGGFIWVA